MLEFLTFNIKDFFDILLVAILLYQFYKLFKGTRSMNVFVAIFAFIVIWFIVKYLVGMELLGSILDSIMSVGAVILIIFFQDEIRQYLSRIGRRTSNGLFGRLKRFFFTKNNGENQADINEIIGAVDSCATTKTGLLIVIQQDADLTRYAETGEIIDARISSRLLGNLFFKNTPLHDGAVIIHSGKIEAAGCILPVSHNLNIPKHYGLRHRAALGISERTDALALVVSEETGLISVAHNGEIETVSTAQALNDILKDNK